MKEKRTKLAGMVILVLSLMLISMTMLLPVSAASTSKHLGNTVGDIVAYSAIPISLMTVRIMRSTVILGVGILVLVACNWAVITIYEHVGKKPPYAIGGFNGSLDLNNNTFTDEEDVYTNTLGVFCLQTRAENAVTAGQSIFYPA